VKPWERLAQSRAPDGNLLELRRRGHEYLILAGGYDLMSSEDESSSRALAELGCAHIRREDAARVLVGGLGMGYTLRAALDATGTRAAVEVAELVEVVAEWNRGELGALAKHPLDDPRAELVVGDVADSIRQAKGRFDAILLDVDNGPEALAHEANSALYGRRGLKEAWAALRPGGVLGVWSFSDEPRFTARLRAQGFEVDVRRVDGSRKGRGRYHWLWIARRPRG
jgi:spermidine synthase